MANAFCKDCQQEIIFARNRESGAKTPLDPRPDDNFGKLLLDHGSMTFVKLDAEMIQRAIERRAAGQEAPLYANHLATCPKTKRREIRISLGKRSRRRRGITF
jgi:hypothetical protein